MFDFKELIDELFNNNSCYSCCNNKNERDTIIIPAKDNKVYDCSRFKPTIASKNKYSDKDVKKELEYLMNINHIIFIFIIKAISNSTPTLYIIRCSKYFLKICFELISIRAFFTFYYI